MAEVMKYGVRPEKVEELERRLEALGVHEDDLVERFVRGGGPGGQKINKTAVAVYLKHTPSGTEVKCQTTRSQAQNRFHARRMLAAKLEAEQLGKESKEAQRVAKIKRQKRKRSRRAKAKMLDHKRKQGEKKERRKKVRPDD